MTFSSFFYCYTTGYKVNAEEEQSLKFKKCCFKLRTLIKLQTAKPVSECCKAANRKHENPVKTVFDLNYSSERVSEVRERMK